MFASRPEDPTVKVLAKRMTRALGKIAHGARRYRVSIQVIQMTKATIRQALLISFMIARALRSWTHSSRVRGGVDVQKRTKMVQSAFMFDAALFGPVL